MNTRPFERILAVISLLWFGLMLGGLLCQMHAQTYQPYWNPKIQLFNGAVPANGAKLCTLSAGTSTPLATYSDNAGTPNTNPVTLDSNGMAVVYLSGNSYKFILYNSGSGNTCGATSVGSLIWSQDNITGTVPLASNNTWSGTNAFTGAFTTKYLASIRFPSYFTGADCGAKINAAFADLAGPGEVWVDQSCGTTWTTAVTISTGQVVRFIQGGTYNLSAAITMSGNSPSLVGTPHGGQSTISFANGGTILKESNSINMANLIIGSGDDVLISDINLDGNKSNNTTTVGVSLTGQRPSIRYSNITSFPSHGISYTNSNDWMDLNHVMVYLNGGHGLSCSSAADLKISQSQFQTNTLNGIDLNNCSGSSISFNEVSGNLNDGIKAYGTAALGSNFLTYSNNLMGQNAQHDIEIVGTDGSLGCLGAYDVQIIGNRINGGGPKAADNTYDILKITDGCHIIVDGNQFFSSAATNRNKYAIENVETGAGRAHDIIIGGSNKFSGTFGTAIYSTTTTGAPTWALPAMANMAYVDSTNAICSVQQLSATVIYNFGCSGQQINFQPASGTNTLVLNGTQVQAYKPLLYVEQAPSSGSSGNDVCQGDPTLHALICNTNNAGWGISKTVALTADWTCGTAGTVSSCVAATIIGSGGGVPLTFSLPLVAGSYTLECDGVVGQATAATANNWNLLTATNGATNVTTSYSMNTAATAMTGGATTDQASTTTTFNIGPTWTLGGTATKMPFHVWAKIEGASASGTVVSLQLVAPTVADLVTIYRGAACRLY